MTARAEPGLLEGATRVLELARQDIEAVLRELPDWAGLRQLDGIAEQSAAQERERLKAVLANVPAYRSHVRVSEALAALVSLSEQTAATRDNGWGGRLSSQLPSLKDVSDERSRTRRARMAEIEPPKLSGWRTRSASGDPWGHNSSKLIDLDHVIALIRRGAASHRVRRLDAMIEGESDALREGAEVATPEEPVEVIAPIVRLPARRIEPEAVPLVPVAPWQQSLEKHEAARPEVITLVEDILGMGAMTAASLPQPLSERPASASMAPAVASGAAHHPFHEVTAERLELMEAEIEILEQDAARGPPPRRPLPDDFDPASVDLTEAIIEIVKKPPGTLLLDDLPELPLAPRRAVSAGGRESLGTGNRSMPVLASAHAPDVEEASIEIVSRGLASIPDIKEVGKRDLTGENQTTAETAVRRFLNALEGRSERDHGA